MSRPNGWERWKAAAKRLKRELLVIFLAYRDPRVPFYVKAIAFLVIAYAFSPIDLIPDFIPILGYLDDLILVPLGIALVVRLLPAGILEEYRDRAQELINSGKPRFRTTAVIFVIIWVAAAYWAGRWALHFLQ